ncbi:myb/SANT-like DNA-binding domain-containing protein 4 [Aricia agestis]|uniref:myb/SANT-like DNA-binding domain-containing protein 4 n=1 Tax=Aricia agestis TaxID=91739 RepID=UPI001C2045FC|nr:myb/SANT-like DNA-binding domain-containing protein 4 [Aricia agestis]
MNVDEDDSSDNVHVSQRSPTFSRAEVETLVRIVAEYKTIVLNKSTNSLANHAKEVAWSNIAKAFNSKGFKNERAPETLKTKWDNLKREAKKLSLNVLSCDLNDKQFLNQVIILMNESDSFGPIDPSQVPLESKENDGENQNKKSWEDENNKITAQLISYGRSRQKNKTKRSLNFSPQEINLLLKCIKSEQDHIFLSDITSRSTKLKRNAWAKVTYIYNKLSTQKRSMKTLRTKFDNMKKKAKIRLTKEPFEIKLENLHEDTDVKVKSEPLFEVTFEKESSPEAVSDDEQNNCIVEQLDDDDYHETENGLRSPDPLSIILNGDSGIESINNFGKFTQAQDKEADNIKLEILKNQLETAKIERQRMAEKVESERREQESRDLEMSMRLRTARLELVAAEAKLPSNHPALEYKHNETKAREYMQQFSNT